MQNRLMPHAALTRRHLLVLAGSTAALALLLPRIVLAQDSAAAGFVQENGNKILGLAPLATDNAGSRQQLLELVNQVLDVDGVARFALGPYSRQATPDQLQKYLQLFHQVISNGVTARLSAYANATFTLGRSEARGGDTLVHSTITRPGSPAADVDWLVGPIDGQMKILDVIAEGTSLRLTERSDYTSYLQNHGGNVDALLT
jgi:phospholipid transport system substrate-binding protein